MTVHRWEGIARATSSIMHVGETLGTVSYLRRERLLMPDGTVEDVPVVSGNALRGVLRDHGADLTWRALGQPALPAPVVHTLWAGGALTKSRGDALTGDRLATLRRTFPHLNVFGAAGAGRIIDGLLAVGKMVPLCAQTAHLLPAAHRDMATVDLWDLLQVEHHSRVPHEGSDESPMRFGAETFVAGTAFYTWLTLTNPSARDVQFLHAVLDSFSRDAHVGGGRARGHGSLTMDLSSDAPVTADPWDDLDGCTPQEATALLKVFR